ncbi:MAG: M23 family metallopeptidase [Candidatus Woesebacteria bacterium]
MNPFLIWNIFSFRQELKYVATAFILVLCLPFVAIIALTHVGVKEVSDQLATVSVIGQAVEIKSPLNGSVIKKVTGPFSWPIDGRITLEFGQSDLPYQIFHTGIDIARKSGDPTHAFMKGKVIYADEISWGYGKHIIIDNGDNISSLYGHLSKINVTKGQEVSQGQIIGLRGSTGWSTGPHLHFETRVFGIPVNPRVFLGK